METAGIASPELQEPPGPQKFDLDAGKAAKRGFKSLRICSEATSGADESAPGRSDRGLVKIEGRAAQTARGQGCKNRSQDVKRGRYGGVERA